MQVSLDAIDWDQLTGFGTAEKYRELAMEDEADLDSVSCYDLLDWGDSGILYFGMARVLQHLVTIADEETAAHLQGGICKIIAESGHPDEFKMAPATGGCYMLSMSPAAVKEAREHVDALDLQRCMELLHEDPAPGEERIMDDLDGIFVGLIRQYSAMVYVAASRSYGLLGHCG